MVARKKPGTKRGRKPTGNTPHLFNLTPEAARVARILARTGIASSTVSRLLVLHGTKSTSVPHPAKLSLAKDELAHLHQERDAQIRAIEDQFETKIKKQAAYVKELKETKPQ